MNESKLTVEWPTMPFGFWSAAFLAGVVWNVFDADWTTGRGDWDNIAVGLALAALFFGLMRFCTRQRGRDVRFRKWLDDNIGAVMARGAAYQGVFLTRETVLVRYQGVLSLLFFSHTVPSRLLVADTTQCRWTGVAYSTATLLVGWWGIPWGPIRTIQYVVRNSKGGVRVPITELYPLVSTPHDRFQQQMLHGERLRYS
jgi:hypothetical protein